MANPPQMCPFTWAIKKDRVCEYSHNVWPTKHWLFFLFESGPISNKQTICRLMSIPVKRGCFESQEVFSHDTRLAAAEDMSAFAPGWWGRGISNSRGQENVTWQLLRANILANENHYHLLFNVFCPIVFKITPALFVSLQEVSDPSNQRDQLKITMS